MTAFSDDRLSDRSCGDAARTVSSPSYPQGGLMSEASVSGQKFSYKPLAR